MWLLKRAQTRPAIREFLHFLEVIAKLHLKLVGYTKNVYEFGPQQSNKGTRVFLIDVRHMVWPDQFIFSINLLQAILGEFDSGKYRFFCLDEREKTIMEIIDKFILKYEPVLNPAESPEISEELDTITSQLLTLRKQSRLPLEGHFIAHLPLLDRIMKSQSLSAFIPALTSEIVGIWTFDKETGTFSQTYRSVNMQDDTLTNQNSTKQEGLE